jgi:hypothetical protein
VDGHPLQNAGTPSTAAVRGPRQRPNRVFIQPERMAIGSIFLQDVQFVVDILEAYKEKCHKNSDFMNLAFMFLSFTPESDPLLGNMTIEDMVQHPDFPDNATLFLKVTVGL